MSFDQYKQIYQAAFPERDADKQLNFLNKTAQSLEVFSAELLVSILFYHQISPDEIEILDLCTHEDYRNKGFATIALTNLFELTLKLKMKRVLLEVAENNFIAFNLYKSLGFTEVSVRKNYYKTVSGAVNAVLMDKIL